MSSAPRPKLATQLLWFIIALSGTLWIIRPHAEWLQFSHHNAFVVGIIIVAVSEAWPIELGRSTIALSMVGYLSVFMLGDLTEAFWVLLIGNALSWLRRGFRGLNTVATLALMVLALQIGAVFYRLGGDSMAKGSIFFALGFILANHVSVNLYYRIRDGRLTGQEVVHRLVWDSLGWSISLPLVAIHVLLSRVYYQWWVGMLALLTYVTVALLLSFYYQIRTAHGINHRAANASGAIAGAKDKEELATRVRDAFADVMGFTTFVLYLRELPGDLLRRELAVHPSNPAPYPEVFVRESEGLTAWALATRLPEFLSNSNNRPSANPSPGDEYPMVSGFILPLVADREICGFIVLGHPYPYGYTAYEFEMAKVLAQHTALAYRKWMLQEEALYLSRMDPLLPQVYNYRCFRQLLDERIRQYPFRPMALALLDMDNFKSINDRYGHQVGDQVLQLFASMIQSDLREMDIFARYGGDEFLVLLDNVSEEGASRAMGRIQHRLSREKWLDLDGQFGVSAGFALYPNDGETPEILLNKADLRMYTDKILRKSDTEVLPS